MIFLIVTFISKIVLISNIKVLSSDVYGMLSYPHLKTDLKVDNNPNLINSNQNAMKGDNNTVFLQHNISC